MHNVCLFLSDVEGERKEREEVKCCIARCLAPHCHSVRYRMYTVWLTFRCMRIVGSQRITLDSSTRFIQYN